MRILVTGANGFIGRNVVRHLSKKHDVVGLTRQVCDLTDRSAFASFLHLGQRFDWTVHTAIVGGRTNPLALRTESGTDMHQNLLMFFNLLEHKDRVGTIINLASGAEYDRSKPIPYGGNILKCFPQDYYGMAKNIIARHVQTTPMNNLRLFGVFGADEAPERFIKRSILRYLDKQPIEIHQDRQWDLFYIEDFLTVLDWVIDNNKVYHDFDLVYGGIPKAFSDVATTINSLGEHSVPVNVLDHKLGMPYLGNPTYLLNLKLPLKGLAQGIKEVYNDLHENRNLS